jgi:hypothetical protein
LAAREDDEGDPAGGPVLVVVSQLGIGSGEALVQGRALRLAGDDRDGLEGLGPRLDGNVRSAARLCQADLAA